MGTEENKAVVRRIMEVVAGGNLDLAEELLVPDFEGLDLGDTGIVGFKAMMTAIRAVTSELEVNMDELIAEGDSVVARWSYRLTLPDGRTTTGRGLSYHRLTGGKVVQIESMTVPDVLQALSHKGRYPDWDAGAGRHTPNR